MVASRAADRSLTSAERAALLAAASPANARAGRQDQAQESRHDGDGAALVPAFRSHPRLTSMFELTGTSAEISRVARISSRPNASIMLGTS